MVWEWGRLVLGLGNGSVPGYKLNISSRIFHLYHQRHGGVSLRRTSAHNNPYLPSQPQWKTAMQSSVCYQTRETCSLAWTCLDLASVCFFFPAMDGPGDRNVLPPVAAGEMVSIHSSKTASWCHFKHDDICSTVAQYHSCLYINTGPALP